MLSDRRKRRVVLNGQWVSWMDVQARVPQGSLFGLFLICKFSAEDTSLFYAVTGLNVTANQINNDLHNIIHGLTNGK